MHTPIAILVVAQPKFKAALVAIHAEHHRADASQQFQMALSVALKRFGLRSPPRESVRGAAAVHSVCRYPNMVSGGGEVIKVGQSSPTLPSGRSYSIVATQPSSRALSAQVLPNSALKRSPNGRPPWPGLR